MSAENQRANNNRAKQTKVQTDRGTVLHGMNGVRPRAAGTAPHPRTASGPASGLLEGSTDMSSSHCMRHVCSVAVHSRDAAVDHDDVTGETDTWDTDDITRVEGVGDVTIMKQGTDYVTIIKQATDDVTAESEV